MNEKLKMFLDTKKEEEKKKCEEEKQKALIKLGLFEKVYSPDNKYSEEFSSYELDKDGLTTKYYKKAVPEITDEEYQELKKYLKNKEITKNNTVATALTAIAWITFVVGFIAGLGCLCIDAEIYFALAFVFWCASLISGTMFLGFAEIIKLLDAIKKEK